MMNFYSPKYKICVSGAAETGHFTSDVLKLAEEIGREIARQDCILVEGATTGFPFWAAKGAKEEGGIVIGFSPAVSEKDHVERFKLPLDYHDLIVYTGFDYSGRNLILTRAADAIIVGPGRMGTINEFTIAFEDKKPIGILEGDWETDETLKLLIERSHRAEEMKDKIIFSPNPKDLVDRLLEIIKINKNHYYIS
ncbi:MAG: LOG family protein [Minisyncoccia bacterium]